VGGVCELGSEQRIARDYRLYLRGLSLVWNCDWLKQPITFRVAVAMHQNPVLKKGLARISMRADMMNLGFIPQNRRFTNCAALPIAEVNDLSFERSV
jgi:hypothetical protein